MSYINIDNVTKDYKNNRGIFNVSVNIKKGECFGIVGINGAGKTTLLRLLMGFIKPESGSCQIADLDCWSQAEQIKPLVSYIPGEIAFPQLKSGDDFLKLQAEFWNVKDLDGTTKLAKQLHLDTSANLKRMSKGMKQKTAIIASLIHDSDILIFDEPTTGLDPLMRHIFMEEVARQKQLGKTIIMSSHLFEEIEECCDRIIMLKSGKITNHIDIDLIRHPREKTYKLGFVTKEDYSAFSQLKYKIVGDNEKHLEHYIKVKDDVINELLVDLSKYKLKYMSQIKQTLEQYFVAHNQTGEEKNVNQ
jgi:ABC-2 type transport system ATP-binding protein